MSEPIGRRSFIAAGAAALLGGGVAEHARAVAAGAQRGRGRPGSPSGLAQAIRGRVLVPGDRGYRAAHRLYNARFDAVRPAAVARPVDGEDAARAVRWALAHDRRVRARSGGHSYAGYSTVSGGIVLDLRSLNRIAVDRRRGTATVGPGCQLIDVYAALAAHGATIPGGSCPSVGIGGLTLGGGMGFAGRAFGLACDHLLAAELIGADGRRRTVDARHDPDLLWALRGGGGGNFAIVTALTVGLRRMPRQSTVFTIAFAWSQAAEAFDAWLRWAPHADDRLTSAFQIDAGSRSPRAQITGQYLGPPRDLERLLGPVRAAGGQVTVAAGGYLAQQRRLAGCVERGAAACHTAGTAPGAALPRARFTARSDYLDRPLPARAIEILLDGIARAAEQGGGGAISCDAYGGAIGRRAPHETAFVHRDQLCGVQYLSYARDSAWLQDTHARMRPYVSGQAYQNYVDPRLEDWPVAYYGANLARLRRTRRRVDPHRFFAFAQAID